MHGSVFVSTLFRVVHLSSPHFSLQFSLQLLNPLRRIILTMESSYKDENPRRPFLRKGMLQRRQVQSQIGAQQKRAFLEERLDEWHPKSIVYPRKRNSGPVRRVLNVERTYGRGLATPIGSSDRGLIKALRRAAESGDLRAKAKLERIFSSPFEIKLSNNPEKSPKDEGDPIKVPAVQKNLETSFLQPAIGSQNILTRLVRKAKKGKRFKANGQGEEGLLLPSFAPESSAIPLEEIIKSDSDDKSSLESAQEKKKGKSKSRTRNEKEESRRIWVVSKKEEKKENLETCMTTLRDILRLVTDKELLEDDQTLRNADHVKMADFPRSEEKEETCSEPKEPDTVPNATNTNLAILRLELRVASSDCEVWMTDSEASKLPFRCPNPDERSDGWPEGFLDWWLAFAKRRDFLRKEIFYACEDPVVKEQAHKYGVNVAKISGKEAIDPTKNLRYKAFRDWYFGKEGTFARQQLLGKEAKRLENAWNSSWAALVKSKVNDSEISARWRIAQSFSPDPEPIRVEKEFSERWGKAMIWNSMPTEEQDLELEIAKIDHAVCILAESDGVDVKSESFRLWYGAHSEVREMHLKKEVRCAAKDFALKSDAFPSNEQILPPGLQRQLSHHLLSLESETLSTSNTSEDGELEFSDENDGAVSDDGTRESDTSTGGFKSREDLLPVRKSECQHTKEDLERGTDLYLSAIHTINTLEKQAVDQVVIKFDESCQNVREAIRAQTEQIYDSSSLRERVQLINALEEKCENGLARLRELHREKEMAIRREMEFSRYICKMHLEALRKSHQAARENLLECSGPQKNGDFLSSNWDSSSKRTSRSNARALALNQLEFFNSSEFIVHHEQKAIGSQSLPGAGTRSSLIARQRVSSRLARSMTKGGINFQAEELDDDVENVQSRIGSKGLNFDEKLLPMVENFRNWYTDAKNKRVRQFFLRDRMQKFASFRNAMNERGDAQKLALKSVFDAESTFNVPELDTKLKSHFRRMEIYSWFELNELEEDDDMLKEAQKTGDQALKRELEALQREELERLREKLREDLDSEEQPEVVNEESLVQESFCFTGPLPHGAFEDVAISRFPAGDGRGNGDEEHDLEMGKIEAQRKRQDEEKRHQNAELILMRKEDNDLRIFYLRERRAMLANESEADLNARAMKDREENLQRANHPLGLCWRELREVERSLMEMADVESRSCWNLLSESKQSNFEEIEMAKQEILECHRSDEEFVMSLEEQAQRREIFENITREREAAEMQMEDLAASLFRHRWEKERKEAQALEWMESVAFANFTPFFQQPLLRLPDIKCHRRLKLAPANKTKKLRPLKVPPLPSAFFGWKSTKEIYT